MDNFIVSYGFKVWLMGSLLWIILELLVDKHSRKNRYNRFYQFASSVLDFIGVAIFFTFFVLLLC